MYALSIVCDMIGTYGCVVFLSQLPYLLPLPLSLGRGAGVLVGQSFLPLMGAEEEVKSFLLLQTAGV